MVDTKAVLGRYFDMLANTGHSNDGLKVFLMSCLCDWRDEMLDCNECWEEQLNKACGCLNGSSCVFRYGNAC